MPRTAQHRLPFTYFLPYVGLGRKNQAKDREASKMTNKELARRIGIGERTICRYKAVGVAPEMFDRMCQEIGKHPVELLGRKVYQEFFGNAGPNPEGISVLSDPILGDFARECGWVDEAEGLHLHRPVLGSVALGQGGRGSGEVLRLDGGCTEAVEPGDRASGRGDEDQGEEVVDSLQAQYARRRVRGTNGRFLTERGPLRLVPEPDLRGGEDSSEPDEDQATAAG